jgi:hypothetical protein
MGQDENALNAIDAVITWVDGNDPRHRKKRRKALKKVDSTDGNPLSTGTGETRFIDNGELRYCLASIRTFAPWIRNIYLVTDNQKPAFLNDQLLKDLNIIIIDHKVLFRDFEWALPTFNSRTIETALWRIPNIAPRFIYFNDDFILTAPVNQDHFFDDGKIVLRGKWNKVVKYNSFRMAINELVTYLAGRLFGITRSMHLLLQMRSASLAGFDRKYFRTPHVPHPVYTTTLTRFFEQNPGLFNENIKYPFRDTNQFSSIFLAHHLEIEKDNATLKDEAEYLMINGEMDISKTILSKLEKIKKQEVSLVCLQGVEKVDESLLYELETHLKQLFNPSPLIHKS